MFLILLAATAPALWGTTYLFTTLWLDGMTPLWISVIRMTVAGVFLILFTRWLPRGVNWWRTALIGTIALGFFSSLLFFSAYRLPGGIAGALTATLPLQMMLIKWLIYRTPPEGMQWLAVVMGIAGVALLTLQSNTHLDGLGITAALLSMSCVAVGILLTQHWGIPDNNVLGFAGWQVFFGGLVLLPLAWLIEGVPAALTADNLQGLTWMIVPNTVFAYAAWVFCTQRLEAVKLSFFNLLNPVVAIIAGGLVLNETLSHWQWAGVALVMLSLVTATIETRNHTAVN